jgi:hypothetical protein
MRFDTSLQHMIQSVTEKITSLDMTMKADSSRMQQELIAVKDQLVKDILDRTNELTESKVSREMMAEALIELGMKVKAGERLTELKLISQKKPSA